MGNNDEACPYTVLQRVTAKSGMRSHALVSGSGSSVRLGRLGASGVGAAFGLTIDNPATQSATETTNRRAERRLIMRCVPRCVAFVRLAPKSGLTDNSNMAQTTRQLEARLERVEKELAELKSAFAGKQTKRCYREIVGVFSGVEDFAEITRLGRLIRQGKLKG